MNADVHDLPATMGVSPLGRSGCSDF